MLFCKCFLEILLFTKSLYLAENLNEPNDVSIKRLFLKVELYIHALLISFIILLMCILILMPPARMPISEQFITSIVNNGAVNVVFLLIFCSTLISVFLSQGEWPENGPPFFRGQSVKLLLYYNCFTALLHVFNMLLGLWQFHIYGYGLYLTLKL